MASTFPPFCLLRESQNKNMTMTQYVDIAGRLCWNYIPGFCCEGRTLWRTFCLALVWAAVWCTGGECFQLAQCAQFSCLLQSIGGPFCFVFMCICSWHGSPPLSSVFLGASIFCRCPLKHNCACLFACTRSHVGTIGPCHRICSLHTGTVLGPRPEPREQRNACIPGAWPRCCCSCLYGVVGCFCTRCHI